MKKDDGEAGFFAKERWECTGKAESHTLEKWKRLRGQKKPNYTVCRFVIVQITPALLHSPLKETFPGCHFMRMLSDAAQRQIPYK